MVKTTDPFISMSDILYIGLSIILKIEAFIGLFNPSHICKEMNEKIT